MIDLLKSETIRVYETDNSWVEYCEYDCKIFASAHIETNKYSIGMMRAMLKVLDIQGEVYSQLKYPYLLNFYNKHFDLEPTGEPENSIYIIRKRDGN